VVSHSLRRGKGKSGLASRVHALAQVHKWPSVSRTSSSGSVIGVGVRPFGCILGTCDQVVPLSGHMLNSGKEL
jgi:hypothetical protein